jgi:hypothetical protein
VTPAPGTGRVPDSPYQSAPAPATAESALPADPTPPVVPPVETVAEPPALRFTKPAVGRAVEAPGSAAFHPDLMIQQSAMQLPGAPPNRPRLGPDQIRTAPNTPGGDDTNSFDIQLEPPGALRLFRFESEDDLFRRVRQDSVKRGTDFYDAPVEPIISTEEFAGRQWAPATEVVEPGYVCYGRLLFEDRNSERYGWDLGFIQPFVSLGLYYYDFVFLPYHAFEDPCRCCECNTGYCLPGDPVPYVIYPPRPSVAGAVAEAAAVLGIIAVFP